MVHNTQPYTQCGRILAALRLGDITSAMMIDDMRIFKYSSRIADLRAKGCVIKATRTRGSLWSYHLVSEPHPTTNMTAEEATNFLNNLKQETNQEKLAI